MEPTGFDRLLDIVRRLRAPDGCPWDRAQDPGTLRGNLIEEAYEAISAIEEGDDENLREELGDLLLVATMIAYMKEQEGRFRVAEVLEHICAKLVRRHPHVFGGPRKDTPGRGAGAVEPHQGERGGQEAEALGPGAGAAHPAPAGAGLRDPAEGLQGGLRLGRARPGLGEDAGGAGRAAGGARAAGPPAGGVRAGGPAFHRRQSGTSAGCGSHPGPERHQPEVHRPVPGAGGPAAGAWA